MPPPNTLTPVRSKFRLVTRLGIDSPGAAATGIGGGNLQEFETVHVTTTNGLNGIPHASAMLAVGRNIRTGELARIHESARDLTALTRAEIVLEPEGEFAPGVPWPEGQHVIFDGFVTGIGTKRANGRIHLVVNLIHWLSDLSYSSALNANSHPSNPFTLHHRASMLYGSAGGQKGSFVGANLAQNALGALDPTQDLWGGIKKVFCAITGEKFVQFSSKDGACIGPPPGDNTRAADALRRIEGESGDTCDFPLEFGVTSTIIDNEGIRANVANAIREQISQVSVESWRGTTLWNKLMDHVGQFLLGVVPMVDRALVVPFVPCLRTTWREVELEDQAFVEESLHIPRPIRSVAIWSKQERPTGYIGKGDPVGFGGCFSPDEESLESGDGLALVRTGPRWANNLSASDTYTEESQGTKGDDPVNLDGTLSSLPNQGGSGNGPPEEIISRGAPYLARYAQALYYNEVLRGRVGQFSGKLRFDIAPGSSIKINGAQREPFINSQVDDDVTEPIYAVVTSVSTGLNAEQSTAATGYQIAYIRTEAENQDNRFSTDRHAFFEQTHPGAPLVPELAFEE
jgi:hypothetical protein